MKIKSVSGFTCYSSDLKKTRQFHERLRFKARKVQPERITVYGNWFWSEVVPSANETRPEFAEAAQRKDTDAGIFVYPSVENVDEFLEGCVGADPGGPVGWQ